jgi:diguanylate cyclase (GGDEF)-like protein
MNAPVSADMVVRFQQVHAALQANDLPRAFDGARAALQQALQEAAAPVDAVAARYWLAKCHYVANEIDVAITLAAEAADAASHVGEPIWLARAQTVEARCLEQAGETDGALDLALMALHELEKAGRVDDEAQTVQQAAVIALGNAYLQLGDLPLALQWCQRGADLALALNDQAAYGAALDTVACVHSAQAAEARGAGQVDEAEQLERQAIALSTQAVDIAQQIGHVSYESSALLNLAESLTLVGEAPRALWLLQDWAQRHPQAVPRHQAHQLDSLGQVYLAMGQADEAAQAFQQALQVYDASAYRAVITEHLSMALERCGRWREALEQHKAFHALQMRISAERAQRSARVAVARLDIERERARARRLDSSNQMLRRRADDLTRLAHEDALTGLPNRRQVERLLGDWPRSIALALIDVDRFKQVNDRYSHAVGDAVLQQLASIMLGCCRRQDVAARLGGEEFVLILDVSQEWSAVTAAERLRAAVEAFPWASLAAGLQVTVSIGVASAAEAADGQGLLALADKRLYVAKREGRNRVVHADH